jgi:hypothetical protein
MLRKDLSKNKERYEFIEKEIKTYYQNQLDRYDFYVDEFLTFFLTEEEFELLNKMVAEQEKAIQGIADTLEKFSEYKNAFNNNLLSSKLFSRTQIITEILTLARTRIYDNYTHREDIAYYLFKLLLGHKI